MKNLYKKFYHSLKWTSIESIAYQSILLMHHLFLFKVCSYRLYGITGAIFSTVYLIVTVTNFGLESSISPFFTHIITCKTRFKSFLLMHIAPTFLLTSIAALCFIFLKTIGFTHRLSSIINPTFFALLIILVLCESLKKTLRSFLHLAFLNYATTSIEVVTVIMYVASIWICYMFGFQITVGLIFIPMVITSTISTVVLALFVYSFYKQLPKNVQNNNVQNNIDYTFHMRIIRCRLFNFFNQISHIMFSGNFLVPFFAIQFGLEQAGIFKLICHICYGVTTIVRKIFGWTSDAVLAQTKHLKLQSKQDAFSMITQKLHHALYGIIIFFAINHSKIMTYATSTVSHINWPLVYFFIIITLSENFFIPYEKFYIAEEKTSRIFIFNVISILLLMSVISYTKHFSQLLILISIVGLRAVLFATLGIVSFYTWKIKPKWRFNPFYIATSVCIAFIFFFLF